ncbi:hypothetical protein [Roseisolibacter sp. H3M3-2]|uniref:hypothetical protein n=1 Tax=Roseisolibacter sp. H3M3-2 TaxID=3031323 RepID=UPI0023DB9FCC|nr:hypothetical protein [Roseisolibacter sp. H3M3-2]MDF1502206.1 hypothetical protein [Roseisolibacter sp. H3M3-2]
MLLVQPPSPPPAAEQIAAAVLPLPAEQRASATVLGYDAGGRLVTLREGTGAMRCLADDPKQENFHVACYHKALEPFMARGRSLRAEGVTGTQVDTVRFKEIAAGKLDMPRTGGALYTLTGPAGSWNAATGRATGTRPLFVYYMPFATAATTGISEKPSGSEPWLMFPGTPKAHVMLVGTMSP